MLLFTAKLSKKKLAAIAVAAALITIAAAVLLGRHSEAAAPVFVGAVRAEGVKTNEDRVSYLASLGWEVDPAVADMQEAVIPGEFTEAYSAYNELQLSQGCDLTEYAGKRARRYSYRILNWPGPEEVFADVIVCRGSVIGGDVCCRAENGFMKPLLKS